MPRSSVSKKSNRSRLTTTEVLMVQTDVIKSKISKKTISSLTKNS